MTNFYAQQGGSGITLESVGNVTNDPTGFPVTSDGSPDTDSNISFDNATRTFTIEPAVDQFSFYIKGKIYTKTAAQTSQITDTEGLWYFYFDENGTIQNTQTFSASIITEYALIAAVYWDATNNQNILLAEERHQLGMDGYTHSYLHYTRGTQYDSGLALSDFVISNGADDEDAQFSFATGKIRDEDLLETLSAVAKTTGVGIYYKDGASALWRRTTQAGFSCKTTGTGRLAYNQNNGGTWQLTEVTSNRYVLYHIFATPGKTNQFISVMGEAEYQNITAAREGAADEINTISLAGLPSVEFKAIGTVIFQTNDAYANSVKARVVQTDLGDDYVDFRFTSNSLSVSGVSSHSNLSDLGNDDHAQYALLAGRSGGQTLIGGSDASDELTLQSTSNATKGKINIGSNSSYDETLDALSIGRDDHQEDINGTTYTGRLIGWVDDGDTTYAEIGIGRAENTTAAIGATLFGARSRGTLAAKTVVQDGDNLLDLVALGHDGTDYAISSRIDMEVDGIPGDNDMPGRIVFKTSNDGAQSATEVLRLSADKSLLSKGVKRTLATKTADYSMVNGDHVILADGTSASVDITLPTPSAGREVVIKAINISNTVRILPNAAETIDGQANITFAGQYESKTLISDGTNWFVIGINGAVVL